LTGCVGNWRREPWTRRHPLICISRSDRGVQNSAKGRETQRVITRCSDFEVEITISCVQNWEKSSKK
jgi:hypothetical protein